MTSDTTAIPGRWFILLVLVTSRTVMGFQFQTVGPISPLIMDALQIDYAELGTLIGFYMLPGIVVALPSGILGRRYGDAKMILFGLALATIGGLIMGFGETFGVVSAGRMIAGTGAIFLNVLMVKMVTDWFSGPEIVIAISVLISSWPLGIGIGLISFPTIATVWSWQAVMHISAAFAFLSFILMAWKYRRPAGAIDAKDEGFRIGLLAREWWLIFLAGMVWGPLNVAFIIMLSFGPDYFVGLGYTLSDAGFLVGLSGWLSIPLVPLGGYIAARYGRQTLFMMVCFLASFVGMIYLGMTASPVVVFTAAALISVFPAALVVALPPTVLRPSARGAGLGLFFTLFYVCMAVLPGVAGWTRDLTGDPIAPFYFGALMLACSCVALVAFRVYQQKLPIPAHG